MFKRLKISILFVLFIHIFCISVRSQDSLKHTLKLGIGTGVYDGTDLTGFGVCYSIGYQRYIWKNRIRFNPNFSFGHYSTKFMYDAKDQYFNSLNLEANWFFDLGKIEYSALVLGVGTFANHSRGLIGTSGKTGNSTIPTSEYVNYTYLGGYVGAGLRFFSSNKRLAFNFMPVNIHFSYPKLIEWNFKLECDIKL